MDEKGKWDRRLFENKDDFLIVISFCQLIEKIIRFRNFLKKATYAIELYEPKPKILEFLDEHIVSGKEDLVNYITNFTEDYETFNEIKKQSLLDKLLLLSMRINDYHRKGLLWVFCPWPEKVTNDFLKQIYTDADVGELFEKLNGTIVLIHEYNFWQYALYKDFKSPIGKANHIFGLPKIELENCFLWQTLVHEVGHAFLEENRWLEDEKSILDIIERVPSNRRYKLKNWINEFGSDLIALKTIGPSYLITLIIYSVTNIDLLWGSSEEHPPIKLRIDFMFEELARSGISDSNEGFNYLNRANVLFGSRLINDIKLQKKPENSYKEDDLFEISFLKNLVEKISETLDKLYEIKKFNLESFKKSQVLANKLSDGVLISSSHKKSHIIELEEKNINKIIEEFDELPNSMAEIITAGTFCKFYSQINWFFDSFIGGNKSEYQKCFDKYRNKLKIFDQSVSKSIEIALIHSYFAKNPEFKEGE